MEKIHPGDDSPKFASGWRPYVKTTCSECPFVRGRFVGLPAYRAQEIADALRNDESFACHKTLFLKVETPHQRDQVKACAGAIATLTSEGKENRLMRLSENVFGTKAIEQIRDTSECFNTLEEFISFYTHTTDT